jgi:hypothetical protein
LILHICADDIQLRLNFFLDLARESGEFRCNRIRYDLA